MKNPDRTVIQATTTTTAPARRALKRRAPAPLVLEQRIMFDGAAVDTAVAARAAAEHAAADGATAERAAAEKQAVTIPAAVAAPAVAPARQEIVFIEDNVVNLQQLVAGVREGVEVVVLDHTRDGLQQMLAALQGHAPVDAIHLVTHGSSGQIELGSTISGANIEQYRDQFSQLGQSLTADGDLLIYGCDVAEGAAGQAFVDRLAALTQADVAASTDVTGSAAFKGNWTLETQHGAIETAAMALDRAGWQGELAVDTVYNANWQQLVFNGADSTGLTAIIGTGRNSGDVMRFNNVITIKGQAVDAVVTTTLDRATLSTYDSTTDPSPTNAYFQPNMRVTTAGGGVVFTIDFYKGGTYTGVGTGTVVTLQNVAVNSYDIDAYGNGTSDRQYQQFKGFSRYELSTSTFLTPTTQTDGSVTFQYVATAGINNGPIETDAYRVKVYYDSMSSFQIKSGAIASGSGSFNGTAYFALDFSKGLDWGGDTNIVGTPAANLTYSTTNFTEATANDGSFTMSSTITLSGGSSTFSGSDGAALSGVTFSNTPAGLTAEITRTSATTATLKFTGNATAHANANDISNFGVSFGNGAFSGVLASAVTGAARSDIVVDFADPAANNAPTASGTSFTIAEDTLKSGSLPSATDIDGDSITYSKGSDPAHGTVVVNDNGTYLYTPTANYNGADSFTYKVTDSKGASNTYTVAITVSPVNDAPTASGTAITANEDSVKSGSLPAATDVDGDAVTYIKGSDPAHGTVVVNANGTYTYTPVANYNGADSFTYTVSDGKGGSNTYTVAVTVSPVNDAPVAANGTITTNSSTAKFGTLPVATDVDGDTVTYSKGSNPAHGTLVVNDNGTYTYTPTAGYNGADSFTYTVSDGNGGSNTYTVSVTVNAVPVAGNNSVTLNVNTPKSGSLPTASDADGDTVTYIKATNPTHGTVVVNANGSYTYTPTTDYRGSDSFTYTVSDGKGGSNTYTISLTVNAAPVANDSNVTLNVNTPKTGSLPTASDADGDAVTYTKATNPTHGTIVVNANGTYTYTPTTDYRGPDSFTYTVSDGKGGSNTYTISLTVNAAPVAGNDSITLHTNTPKSGSLPTASDADGDAVTYAKATDPAHGTVVVNANGTYTYTPTTNYNGADSFTYTVSDGKGGSNSYTVSVAVVNVAPVAGNDSITLNVNTPKSGSLPTASDADGDTVTYTKATNPTHGTVVVNASGSYTYTPTTDYRGSDSFTYTVSDGNGGSNTYTISLTVNAAPVAGNDSVTLNVNTPKTGSLPTATDADGDAVTYTKATNPTRGTVVVNANGSYTYTPTTDYRGSDSFTYTVSDGKGGSNTYTISLTVNAAPVAGNDSIKLNENTVKSGNLPSASDADGDTVNYTKATDPAHGTVVVNSNGTYTYTPTTDYHGADSFTYTVSDGKGGSNTYTVSIVVNDVPVAADANITLDEDTVKSGSLPAATDLDGDTVTYTKASDPAHGTVVVNANGTYTYTPAANYNGADSFTYTVSDGNGGSNTYTVSLTINPVNDAPVGSGTTITTAEDTVKTGTLPVATDVDGDTVTYGKGSDPAHGTVVVNANGTYTYTPAADYNGADSFTYTVSDGKGGSNTYTVAITVTPVNDAPVAGNDRVTLDEDTVKTGTLPVATDVDGDTVTYTKASDPAHGTVVVNANGSYTYTPVADYNGADSFTYTVSDGNGGSNTYTVSLTINPVNDAPVGSGTTITTSEDAVKTGNLPPATDVDGDTVTYTKASDPSNGTFTINPDGSYSYAPAADYNGNDSFTYTISDGKGGSNTYTVAITVTPVNDAPVAGNDSVTLDEDTVKTGTLPVATDVDGDTVTYAKASDPAHGTVVVNANGSYTYTPVADYNGADSFTYTVSDGNGGSNTYTVSLTINPVNDAPVGSGTTITTPEDTVKTGTLPVATDVDGDTVTYGKGSDPAHGTVVVNPNGSYTYTPAADYNGNDSFSYTITDGKGGSNTYVVNIVIDPVNDAPVGSGTTITTPEDTVKTGNLPPATDVDGDTVTYTKASDPSHGTVTVNPDGSYSYAPTADYNGNDSFSYTINDGKGGSNTYVVNIVIDPVNDAPVGSGTTITTSEDTVKTGTLPVATDVDGDTVTYGKGSDPAHGTVVVNPNGSYTYTPAANYNGNDSFTYTITDGKGGSNTYLVNIVIDPVNDAPVGSGTTITTPEDTVKTGTLPVATDVDGDTVTYGKGSDPAHGTVVVNPNGSYTYTPAANYNGNDSFTYTITDGKGGSNTYLVNIVIDPVNDAPVGSGTTISTPEDTVKTGTLPVATDVDGDTVTYGKGSDPAHGTIVVNPNGSYTYTPAANYNGADSFSYTINDGKGGSNTYVVNIVIDPVNDAPVGSGTAITTAEDTVKTGTLPVATDVDGDSLTYGKGSDPAHGTVVVNPNGTYTYTPAANYNGVDSFTYTVSDGKGGSSTYTVNVIIDAVNDAPTASDANVSVDEDAVLTGRLPVAVDVDGETPNYGKGSDPAHGTVTVNPDGSYTYTPVANYNGADSFTYTVSDGKGGNNTYTVNVTVNSVNDAPVAPGSVPTPADLSAGVAMPPLTVPAFSDVDGGTLNYTATLANGSALPGWLVFDSATRTFSGTPASDAAGTYTVVVRGSDGAASASVTVNFTVLPLPPQPVTVPDVVTVPTPVVADAPPPAAPLPVAALPPLPTLTTAFEVVDTRTTPADVLSVSASGSLIQLDGRGIRADMSNPDYRRSAEMSDLYTAMNGFRTVVAKAENPALMLFQGVPDQYTDNGRPLVLTIPSDAFVHTQADAVVRLSATLQDGRPLPSWVQFDAQTGKFTGEVPKGLVGELRIKLTARDIGGHEATALFRINVGQAKNAMGKSGLSEQLRQASAVSPSFRVRA